MPANPRQVARASDSSPLAVPQDEAADGQRRDRQDGRPDVRGPPGPQELHGGQEHRQGGERADDGGHAATAPAPGSADRGPRAGAAAGPRRAPSCAVAEGRQRGGAEGDRRRDHHRPGAREQPPSTRFHTGCLGIPVAGNEPGAPRSHPFEGVSPIGCDPLPDQPQIAPCAAEPTSLAYLARTPRVYRGAGGAHPSARRASSASSTSRSSVRAARSSRIGSPSRTNAIGPPSVGLGGDVADAQAGGAAGEAAVGQQQHVLAEAGALDRAGHGQHLAHARPALGPLVADDDDVARLQRALGDGVHGALLAVEDPRGALEDLGVEAGRLHDRALGGQRARAGSRARRSCGSGRSSRG